MELIKKLDLQLISFGVGLVYFALIALIFVLGVAMFFAIPIIFLVDFMRGDHLRFLEGCWAWDCSFLPHSRRGEDNRTSKDLMFFFCILGLSLHHLQQKYLSHDNSIYFVAQGCSDDPYVQVDAVKATAKARGVPYTRFVREVLE